MKWFLAISEASLSEDDLYANCIRVAVASAKANTSLKPILLYDGDGGRFVEELKSLGVQVKRHRTALYRDIVEDKPSDDHYMRIASGAFLRIDIPIIEENDDFVLYTDCDVLFLKDPDLSRLAPKYFAVAPEFHRGDYNSMNSGVMLINPQYAADLR